MKLKTAVIGVGVQGERHAEKFAALPASALLGVADADIARARAVAERFGVEAVADYRQLLGAVDAVAIATPTSTHHDIARCCFDSGVHALLEKPLAASTEQARDLVERAESRGLVFQVGHLERFNPAVKVLGNLIDQPQFIESNRIAPYKPRALDVSVVLDLMIHDIDLIHSFVRSSMKQVDAVGRCVFSGSVDVANARIQFANGCIANVTSSRISRKSERSLRIFQNDAYLSADLEKRRVTSYRRKHDGAITTPQDVLLETSEFPTADPMMAQAEAFLEAVAGGSEPLVSARSAMQALETASVIGEQAMESAM